MPVRIIHNAQSVPAGLEHEQRELYDYFSGPKLLLIAQGLASDGQFPGDPGCGRTSMTYAPDGTRLTQGQCRTLSVGTTRIERFGGAGKFRVRVRVSDDEAQRRRTATEVEEPVHRKRSSAAYEKKPLVAGVTYEEMPWGDLYSGRKEALLAQGVAHEGQFPGDPGCPRKTMVSWDARGVWVHGGSNRSHTEGAITVIRVGPRFRVSVHASDVEIARRKAAQQQPQPAKESHPIDRQTTGEEALALQLLRDEPSTGEEWAHQSADLFWATFQVIYDDRCSRATHASGFKYCAEDREKFLDMARELYWEMREATPLFDLSKRYARVTAARAKAAQVNEPLQRFLKLTRQRDFLEGPSNEIESLESARGGAST